MFRVGVRDHVMIAHSFRGETFGPAQRLHGATYVVGLEIAARELDGDGVVVDIGRAIALLGEVLAPLAYRNLDDLEAFAGVNTTTEVVARYVHEQFARRIAEGALGARGRELHSLKVTLDESHVAWASYEAELRFE